MPHNDQHPDPSVQNNNLDIDIARAKAEAELLLRTRQEEQDQKEEADTGPPTLSERAEDIFGHDPDVERLTFLPYPKGALDEGSEIDWTDWIAPQIVADLFKSAILPGHVYQGGEYNIQDVVKFTLDYAIPAAQSRFKVRRASDKEVLESAPTTEELRLQAGKLLDEAKDSGARLSDEAVIALRDILKLTAEQEGIDPGLHQRSVAALNYSLARLQKGGDMQSVMLARRNLATAARTIKDPDDSRIGQKLVNTLDDFVDNWLSDPAMAAKAKKGRAVWGRMKRSEEIETIIEHAKLDPSYEKGLQKGFKALLKSKDRIRGFNDEDKRLMKLIVKGGTAKQIAQWIGKFSFGSGIIGGTIATTVAYLAGGIPGALGVAALTQAARGMSSTASGRHADLARALVASGRRGSQVVPRRPLVAPPLAAALMPQEPQNETNVPINW
jgi:hypothetical protein